MRSLKNLIVMANGKKINIPHVEKIIVTVRDDQLRQHQASMNVTISNINAMKKLMREG